MSSGSAESSDFRIGKELGGGGFGKVYHGTFNGLEVAIKKVPISDPTPERAAREHHVMKDLDHPNVLKLLDVKETSEIRYFILELCAASLADYITGKYNDRMPHERDCLIHMAEGVRYIHSKDLVHRDIKPDNVLIHVNAEIVLLKISDFGGSKRSYEGEFSLSSRISGHQNYLAPEILEVINRDERPSDLKLTNASDVFALGCTFYKFLTRGDHPFGQGFSIAPNILAGKSNLQKLSKGHLAYPIIAKMIEQSPDRRPLITEICEALGVRQITRRTTRNRRINCSKQSCYGPSQSGEVNCCSFHPTKPKLACSLDDGRVCLFSGTHHSTPFAEWTETVLQAATSSSVRCIDWKVDGKKLAAALEGGTVVVWNEDGTKSFELKHSKEISSISWNGVEEKSHLFVTGGKNQRAIVWDSNKKTALQIFHFHSKWITEVTWISADVFAFCSLDKTIKICQLGRSEPLRSFHHQGTVYSLRWNAEDGRLASCCEDGSIEIWSMDRQGPVATLHSGGSEIVSLDWHRRAKAGTARWCIVGGCGNGEVLIWELQVNGAATNPRKLYGHSGAVTSVAFSADGRFLASADQKGKVLVWCTKKWQAIFQLGTKSQMSLLNRLRWNCEGSKLAIPNRSPEVHVIEVTE